MKRLDERKRRALALLTLGGLTRKEVAAAVGVVPETITKWAREQIFRKELEAWRHGPDADVVRVKQSRRIIIDELARRVLNERTEMNLRDLLTVHDRLTKEIPVNEENTHDDEDVEDAADRFPTLTPEEAERAWAERIAAGETERQDASEHAPAEPDGA